MMYDVFRAAGTSEEDKQFEFALPVLGGASWEEVLQRMADKSFVVAGHALLTKWHVVDGFGKQRRGRITPFPQSSNFPLSTHPSG